MIKKTHGEQAVGLAVPLLYHRQIEGPMKKPGRGQLPTIPCSALRPVLFFAAIVLVIGLSPEGPKTDGRL